MLEYKIDVLRELKDAGYNTNRIRKEKILSETSLQSLRSGKMIGNIALDKLCKVLKCQPGNIIRYVPDKEKTE